MFNIQAATRETSSRFLKSKEYFPIEIKFGKQEIIRITKRPRRFTTEIVDIYSNGLHIGMFVGLERINNELHFGPVGLNSSHAYRGILNYIFIRLLEYFGLDKIELISAVTPDNLAFKQYLLQLGFQPKWDRLVLELTEESTNQLFTEITNNPPKILDAYEQIKNILVHCNPSLDSKEIEIMAENINEKINLMEPIDRIFWDNRKIAQLNYYMVTAELFPEQLVPNEFVEMFLKTAIGCLHRVNREAYLEEIFEFFEIGTPFRIPHIQILLEKLVKIVPNAVKSLSKDHIRKWIKENASTWKLNELLVNESRLMQKERAKLTFADFRGENHPELKENLQILLDHYNREKLFYGLPSRFEKQLS